MNKGYIAIMSVLIISAVGALVAVSLLTVGRLNQDTSFILGQEYRARSFSDACTNRALMNIRLDSAYVGDESITIEGSHCDILSLVVSGDQYTISVETIVGTIVRKKRVEVLRTENPSTHVVTMTLQSLNEIADF